MLCDFFIFLSISVHFQWPQVVPLPELASVDRFWNHTLSSLLGMPFLSLILTLNYRPMNLFAYPAEFIFFWFHMAQIPEDAVPSPFNFCLVSVSAPVQLQSQFGELPLSVQELCFTLHRAQMCTVTSGSSDQLCDIKKVLDPCNLLC